MILIAFCAASRFGMFSSNRTATGWPTPTTSPSLGSTYGIVRFSGECVSNVICCLVTPLRPSDCALRV